MILYFSCTGNTRWAAQEISRATGERMLPITGTSHDCHLWEMGENEAIGFCFPVHGWRPPVVVREFVRALSHMPEVPYCWMLCTAGDDIGETVELFESDLVKATGRRLDAAFSLLMPESYVGLPFMDVDTPAAEARKLRQARADLSEYIGMIGSRRHDRSHLHLSRWPKTNSRLLGGAFVRWLLTDKPFHVAEDLCVGCGQCARACPTGNIRLEDGQPQWAHSGNCLSCFACYHHCPAHAIAYGRRTRHKGQYYFGHRGE